MEEMTRCLLEHRADPLAGDKDDFLPINRAVTRNHESIVKCLVEVMKALRLQLSVMPERSRQALVCAWGIADSRNAPFAQSLFELVSVCIPEVDDQMHCAARAGNAAACRAVKKKRGRVNYWQFDPSVGKSVWP